VDWATVSSEGSAWGDSLSSSHNTAAELTSWRAVRTRSSDSCWLLVRDYPQFFAIWASSEGISQHGGCLIRVGKWDNMIERGCARQKSQPSVTSSWKWHTITFILLYLLEVSYSAQFTSRRWDYPRVYESSKARNFSNFQSYLPYAHWEPPALELQSTLQLQALALTLHGLQHPLQSFSKSIIWLSFCPCHCWGKGLFSATSCRSTAAITSLYQGELSGLYIQPDRESGR
jgi:hypothetical protein